MVHSISESTTASTVAVEAASPKAHTTLNEAVPIAVRPSVTHAPASTKDGETGNTVNGSTRAIHSRAAGPDSIAKGEETTQGPNKSRAGDDTKPDAVLPGHILFPPLPIYASPPSLASFVKAIFFRISAFFLSLAFLGFILIASLVTSIPRWAKQLPYTMTHGDKNKLRPHHEEEGRRAEVRRRKQKEWEHRSSVTKIGQDSEGTAEDFPPTEGGKDRVTCDVAYYARRVGLEVDVFHVRTDDGFLIDLWHVYDPREYVFHHGEVKDRGHSVRAKGSKKTLRPDIKEPKFPVLLIHGLLQSSGAYCCNDDESLAFWLCKSGFDVWLGNNRGRLKPKHESLKSSDPRMWSWTIQHMGIHDLPALTDQVLVETGFQKLGLICHSQGAAQTLVALSKHQRPELGEKITVFCGLAPAAYAGPLVKRYYFRLIARLSPFGYKLAFGIHAFIPLMMRMRSLLSPSLYGWMAYRVYSFLFDWSDARWDRGLRDRLFQSAPVYVSSETMRWWLGQDGFASHGCILSTRGVVEYEDEADGIDVAAVTEGGVEQGMNDGTDLEHTTTRCHETSEKRGPAHAATPWYNEQAPPFALWVCGNDQLVDGRRLLRRFETGREPHVKLVHSKVIEQYEHLDVLWAIDAVEQVFEEMGEVLWKTCHDQEKFRVPRGCLGSATADVGRRCGKKI